MNKQEFLNEVTRKLKKSLKNLSLSEAQIQDLASNLVANIEPETPNDLEGTLCSLEALGLIEACQVAKINEANLKYILNWETLDLLSSNQRFLAEIHFLKSQKARSSKSLESEILDKIQKELSTKTSNTPIDPEWLSSLFKSYGLFQPFKSDIDRIELDESVNKILAIYYFHLNSKSDREAWFNNAEPFYRKAKEYGLILFNEGYSNLAEKSSVCALVSLKGRNKIFHSVDELFKAYKNALQDASEMKSNLLHSISRQLNLTISTDPILFEFKSDLLEIVDKQTGDSFRFSPKGFKAMENLYKMWSTSRNQSFALSEFAPSLDRMKDCFTNLESKRFQEIYLNQVGARWAFKTRIS